VDLVVAYLASDAYHSQNRVILSALKFLNLFFVVDITFKKSAAAYSKDGEFCADIFVSYFTSVLVLVLRQRRLKLSLMFVAPTSPTRATNLGSSF